jgi:hypothetical protein
MHSTLVTLLRTVVWAGRIYPEGDTLELPAATAASWVASGHAPPAEAPGEEDTARGGPGGRRRGRGRGRR